MINGNMPQRPQHTFLTISSTNMEIVDSIWFSRPKGSKSNHNYCLKLSPQKKTHCFRSMVLDSFRGMQCADNFVITTDAHCKNFRDDFKMVIAMITKLTMIWHHCCDDGLIWFISPQINLINMLQVKRSNLQPLWPWWLHLREGQSLPGKTLSYSSKEKLFVVPSIAKEGTVVVWLHLSAIIRKK